MEQCVLGQITTTIALHFAMATNQLSLNSKEEQIFQIELKINFISLRLNADTGEMFQSYVCPTNEAAHTVQLFASTHVE